jgi:serine phosphatase RsbU (regulator of sigma subunit)
LKKAVSLLPLLIFLMCCPLMHYAQVKPPVKQKIKSVGDTATINRLISQCKLLNSRGQYNESLILAKKAQYLSKKIGYKAGLARSYNYQGVISYRKGNYPGAVDLLKTALMIAQLSNDSITQSLAYNNLGNANAYMGDHTKALEYYFKGLNIEEKISVKNNLHWYYSNIANLYSEQKNFKKAFEYAFKAVKVEEATKNKGALSVTLSNIAGMHSSSENYDSALYYYMRALPMAEELKDTFSIALTTSNVALTFTKLKQYQSGYNYSMKSLKICRDKSFKDLIVYCLQNLGDIDVIFKKYESATKYYEEAITISKQIKSKLLIRDSYLSLANLYKSKDDYGKAYQYYKLYSESKDSVLNEENSKLMTEMNTKYTTEKKEKEIELLKKNEDIQNLELAKKKNELDRQRTVSIGIFVGFLLIMIVAVLMYSRFRLKKKANEQLQSAFNLIEEKNTQIEKSNVMITDSITYAKRIQDAILPAPEDLSKSLSNDFFIFYRPSQIVSGDFYWCSTQGNKTIFVVADCTGHGVPGAFMSMIGNTLLNEIVNERKVTSTKKIAELLDEKIIHSLHQHEGTEKYDGMDISICSIDKTTKEINFTGAHHAMYTYNGYLKKIKGDPFSIGGAQQQNAKIFTSQSVQYEKGLRLYFLTDGYCDQSGGEANKRFSSKKFEAMLEQMQDVDMHTQKEKLEQAFEDWKGSTKQRDDILVVGIKC